MNMQTTDDQEEVYDVVDVNDQVVGEAKRWEVHRNKNLIHRSIGVIVFNSNNKILLQRRSLTKDIDALLWTISCSGHVLKGETYESTAKREMKEELGVEDVTLMYLAKYLCRAPTESEMVTLYKVVHNGPFNYPAEEVLEGKFFTQKELKIALETKEVELSFFGKMALAKIGWV